MIEVRGLTKRYGEVLAVDDLTFAVRPGEVTGFLGPNGAGKSTTLRMILGLDAASSGTTTVGGKPYTDRSAPLKAVGALLDPGAVLPSRTAYHHLLALAAGNGIPRSVQPGGAGPAYPGGAAPHQRPPARRPPHDGRPGTGRRQPPGHPRRSAGSPVPDRVQSAARADGERRTGPVQRSAAGAGLALRLGGDDSIVASYISYLRRKIDTGEVKLIHTVRGTGYVLRRPPA